MDEAAGRGAAVGSGALGKIELIQLLFLSWRSPSLDDVGWNSAGTVIGFLLWAAACVGWRWRLNRGGGE